MEGTPHEGTTTMMTEDKVLCQNPDPAKQGTRIPRWKYDLVSDAIFCALGKRPDGLPFRDLPTCVRSCLTSDDAHRLGSVSWHTTVVKLDLEARGRIERVPGSKPQLLREIGA
jgi:hypothetical protein